MTAVTAPTRAGSVRTRRGRHARRLTVDNVIASCGLTLLTIATAIGMCRVFGDWVFLRPLVTVAVVIHVSALALRTLRIPVLVALPALALVMYEVIALLFYKDTMRALLPSRETLELLRLDLRLVWTQFPTAVAPVPSSGSYLVAAAFGIALVALLSDAFAFRAFGRVEAAVPSGVLFVFTAALGTDRNRVSVAALWLATAIFAIALLRALHSGTDDSWLGRRGRAMGAAIPATVGSALVVALVAAALGPLLPGARDEPLLDTHSGDGDVTEVLSPLVDIRSRLVSRSGTEMFTVDAAAAQYWRVAGLSEFDGRTWRIANSTLEDAGGFLNRPGDDANILQQRFTISRFGGKLVPTAFAPVEVFQGDVRWLPNTDTIVYEEDTMKPGDIFVIQADISEPSPDALRASSASSPPSSDFFRLPDNFPAEVADIAREVTATATTPYDQALQLQAYFHGFTYDTEVQSGHGNDAIQSFLRIRRGYCEQFAGTFAAMGRALGLPTRVAVGFTQGELQPDGSYHVYGRHAHAWPEVWFDSVGWVQFEPTPGRGAPGRQATTGVAPAQDNTPAPVGTGTPDPNAPAPPPTIRDAVPITEPELGVAITNPGTAPPIAFGEGTGNGGTSIATWIMLALIGVLAWMVLMPILVRRFTHRGRTPADQVIDAWHGTVGALVLAGAPAPAGSTPMEYAIRVERDLSVDHRSLTELARFVTRAIYSPGGVGEPAALRAAVLRTQLEETAREMTPWHGRLLGRLDPRLVRQRLVG